MRDKGCHLRRELPQAQAGARRNLQGASPGVLLERDQASFVFHECNQVRRLVSRRGAAINNVSAWGRGECERREAGGLLLDHQLAACDHWHARDVRLSLRLEHEQTRPPPPPERASAEVGSTRMWPVSERARLTAPKLVRSVFTRAYRGSPGRRLSAVCCRGLAKLSSSLPQRPGESGRSGGGHSCCCHSCRAEEVEAALDEHEQQQEEEEEGWRRRGTSPAIGDRALQSIDSFVLGARELELDGVGYIRGVPVS
eukprot:scaffold141868_cov28-Tisochrysis_lutea.AAC.1